MSRIETNIFPIENLKSLTSSYRLYRIRGLRREQAEYHQNRQLLTRKLSFSMRSPVTVIDIGEEPHLVVRDDGGTPPSPFPIIRGVVYFDATESTRILDYTKRDPPNDEICLRFVQFTLQAPLSNNARLWQPGAGKPFFEKSPSQRLGANILMHAGFAVRAVLTPEGGIGLCVDMRHKFLGEHCIGTHFTRSTFRPWRAKHLIYHYGHRWYEIQAKELDDLNVTEYLVPDAGGFISLTDFVNRATTKPIPPELAQLPHDCSVLHYANNQGGDRAAPTGLCHEVFDTQSPEVQRHQSVTTMAPHQRREAILRFRREYLSRLRFGGSVLQLAERPMSVDRRFFTLPDYEFGNGRILSARGTKGAEPTSLDTVGTMRASLLRDRNAGFFTTDPLDRQYLFLPQSVADSCGKVFTADLCKAVDSMFVQERGYSPIVVSYDDRGPRTFVEQGQAILTAARSAGVKPGYGLVMVHEVRKHIRDHDQLAAMVIRELRKELDLHVAVNHSTVCQQSYALDRQRDGLAFYRPRPECRGKLSGYLRNVALNKVLLTSERWPFVLATPLHADLTIGIDVKHNTAGFTIVGRRGSNVRTRCRESSQKERLMTEQVKKRLTEIIEAEARATHEILRHIVLHRDGRLFQSELDGANQAVQELIGKATLPSDATLSVLEISKTSPSPLRLFSVGTGPNGRPWTDNPFVGTYHISHNGHAFLCATGLPFRRAGTVQPLHVHVVQAAMPFEDLLEDLYYLTALTWTRPEDCTRYPITLKLTDRRLGEEADRYDLDALDLDEAEEELNV